MNRRHLTLSLASTLALAACAVAPATVPAPGTRTYGDPVTTEGGLLQPGRDGGAKAFNPALPSDDPLALTTVSPDPDVHVVEDATATSTVVAGSPAPRTALGEAAITCLLFDDGGNAITDGYVRVHSLDASLRFDETTRLQNGGRYNMARVPAGVRIEIEAGVDAGWTKRSRAVTLAASSAFQRFQFGPSDASDVGEGSAFFLSERPEIDEVTLDASFERAELRIKLSEPLLDAATRTAFGDALRIYPANDAADPDFADTYPDDTLGSLDVDPALLTKLTPQVDNTMSNVSVTWNEDLDVATLIFPLALLTSVESAATYQLALVSKDGTQLVDTDGGTELGMIPDSGDPTKLIFGDYDTDNLLYNVFRDADVTKLKVVDSTVERRWGATHQNAVSFKVKLGTATLN